MQKVLPEGLTTALTAPIEWELCQCDVTQVVPRVSLGFGLGQDTFRCHTQGWGLSDQDFSHAALYHVTEQPPMVVSKDREVMGNESLGWQWNATGLSIITIKKMPACRTIFPVSRGNSFIKRPSKEDFNRLCNDNLLPVAKVYRAMKLTGWEGRALSASVKNIIVKGDFDLEKKLSKCTQRDLQGLEEHIGQEIPYFDRYEDQWPISVFIRRHLRNRGQLAEYRTHPQRRSRKPSSRSQSRKDDVLVPLKTPRSHQERYKLRDFLDEHGMIHLLFALTKAGITGDAEFESFVGMPPAVRKAFLSAALDTIPHEVDNVHLAAMQYQVPVLGARN
ncbi:hypothetical protein EDC04DRAFT_2608810 [Pisolithus marmoratus]|nr:hypothetical protein EDC04DRAFT_2608810 [Pisolithus marmoratus]